MADIYEKKKNVISFYGGQVITKMSYLFTKLWSVLMFARISRVNLFKKLGHLIIFYTSGRCLIKASSDKGLL